MSRGKKLMKAAGYSAFFGFFFFLFAYLTFPYDQLRNWIIQEVENPRGPDGTRSRSGYQLEIVDLSPSFFTGVEMLGVKLVVEPKTPDDAPVDVTFERVFARVSLLSLLTADLGVSFEASVAGGTVEGDFERSLTGQAMAIDADLSKVNLRRVGVLRSAIGLPIKGTIDGKIDIALGEDLKETEGNIDVTLKKLMLGDGEAKLKIPGLGAGLTIEEMDAGKVSLKVDIKDGVATVKTLKGRGADVDLDGEGTIRLQQKLVLSRLDLMIRAMFKDGYKNRNDRTKAVFSLLEVNPRLKAAQTKDGAIQYRLNGGLTGKMSATPAGRAAPPGSGK